MNDFFDSQDMEFSCPQCKRSIKSRVGNLKRADYKCPHCGARFDTSDFKRGIDDANREIEKFKKRFEDIKIDIKL